MLSLLVLVIYDIYMYTSFGGLVCDRSVIYIYIQQLSLVCRPQSHMLHEEETRVSKNPD